MNTTPNALPSKAANAPPSTSPNSRPSTPLDIPPDAPRPHDQLTSRDRRLAAPHPEQQGAVVPPTVLAVIPARGGSKGVPAKNLAPVAGVPLVARAVRESLAARHVTAVVVSTDDDDIANVARAAGAEVVQRPTEIAGDTATSEAAVLHAMEVYEARYETEVDVVLLVQCTSPFLTRDDVGGVAGAVAEDGADSALTVAPFHGFLWRHGPNHQGPNHQGPNHQGPNRPETQGSYGVNHDKAHRPRRQDRPQDLLETGAAYAMAAPGFRTAKHRFFGRTDLIRTDPARTLEVDDPHDLARARALAPLLDVAAGVRPTFADLDAVVLDFDGTQTDDRVLIDSEGRELVAVHRGDGLGIAALRRSGLKLLILSTEQNPVVAARARKLQLPVLHGVDRKDLALKRWCEEQGVAPERVLYVGNDVNDLPCFGLVGWPVAVAGAHDVVRDAARAVTTAEGGFGAIREIASWLLGPSLTGATTTAPTGGHP